LTIKKKGISAKQLKKRAFSHNSITCKCLNVCVLGVLYGCITGNISFACNLTKKEYRHAGRIYNTYAFSTATIVM
jgi:hypothetical protein